MKVRSFNKGHYYNSILPGSHPATHAKSLVQGNMTCSDFTSLLFYSNNKCARSRFRPRYQKHNQPDLSYHLSVMISERIFSMFGLHSMWEYSHLDTEHPSKLLWIWCIWSCILLREMQMNDRECRGAFHPCIILFPVRFNHCSTTTGPLSQNTPNHNSTRFQQFETSFTLYPPLIEYW